MRVCVTGGCGFIGVHLVERLLHEGHKVQVLDNFAVAGPERLGEHPNLQVVQVDVRDQETMLSTLMDYPSEAIFHLAALHFIPYCNENPVETLDVNVAGTQNVVRGALKSGVSRLILASSAAVYTPQSSACIEDEHPGPVDAYGFSKWMAELVMRDMVNSAPIKALSARLFNVYGPLETNPHVIPHILEQLKVDGPIDLGNLDSKRDYVFTEDVVDGLMCLLDASQTESQIFNLGTGSAYSVREILQVLEKLLGRSIEVRSRSDLLRKQDRPLLLADPSRIKGQTSWQAAFNLESGLRQLLLSEGFIGSG